MSDTSLITGQTVLVQNGNSSETFTAKVLEISCDEVKIKWDWSRMLYPDEWVSKRRILQNVGRGQRVRKRTTMYAPCEEVEDDVSVESSGSSENSSEGVHKRSRVYVSCCKKSKRGTLLDRLESMRKTADSSDSLSSLDIPIRTSASSTGDDIESKILIDGVQYIICL